MTMCGTGGWNGPLSGDPDNNVILSTVSSYGGVRVSWTMPTTYPFAVAHIAVYRSTANNFSGSALLATVNSSFYFDENLTNNTITYYYWIVVVSIHGTYGNVVGPSVAVSRPTIEHVIELLTGRIDQDVLALSLKEKISNIAVLNTSITTEISNRIAANQALITTIAGLDADVAAAVTAIETQTIQRITDNSAMASQLNLVAAGLADSIAGVAESVTALATPTNAFSEWQLATEATLNGNIAAGQIGLVSQVDTLTGTVGSLYTVKLNTNGLIGGYGVSNDGLTVEAGFDVDKFWVGRSELDPVTQQVVQVKPFIIDGTEVFIDEALVNKLTFTKLIAADGSFVAADDKLTADYINSNNLTIRDASGNVLFGAGKALDWDNVGGSGKPQDGATRNIARGAWTAATNYVVGDSVTYETHSWQCLEANTATTTNKPPTYPIGTNQWWMLTVVGGASGQGQVKGVSFLRAATAPAVPIGGTFASPNAAGWSDGIPADNNQSLWMVTRIFTSNGLAPQQAAWTTPQKIGTPSTGTRSVFSVLGTTAAIGTTAETWHLVPAVADVYMATQTSTNNGVTWTVPTGAVRIKGETGSQGTQGIAGTPGTNGVTYYTWVKYADSPTSGMNDFPDGKAYLGIAYNKTTATESSDYNQYSWSLILGAQGIPGVAGTNGASTYTWIKYGTDAVGSGMADSPVGKSYIGIAVNKPTATESATASDYTWALIKGDAGAAGTNGTNGTRGTRILYDVNNGVGAAGYNSLTTYIYLANAAGAASYAAKATALILTATGTDPIAGDTVYLSNGTNFVNTLSYTGSTWANPGVIVDGSLLVTGSVTSSKINSNGLDVKAADGTVILSSGSTIASQMGVNTNIVQDTAVWTFVNGSSLYTASLTSVDGTTLVLPANALSQCLSPTMDISGLGPVYSVSFKARASVARTLYVDFQPDTMPDASFALTTSWAYYSAVMTVAGTVTNTDRQNCKLRFYGLAAAGAIEVADIKLEVGSVATLWVSNRNALVGLKNPITQANASTYIANAAIGNLQVGTAAISTLKVAGNAITASSKADLQIVQASQGTTSSNTVSYTTPLDSGATLLLMVSGRTTLAVGNAVSDRRTITLNQLIGSALVPIYSTGDSPFIGDFVSFSVIVSVEANTTAYFNVTITPSAVVTWGCALQLNFFAAKR